MVSILAEFISAPMVRKAKSGREIFHQLRNNLNLDVGGREKCPNGVHRGRFFLSPDGATSAKQETATSAIQETATSTNQETTTSTSQETATSFSQETTTSASQETTTSASQETTASACQETTISKQKKLPVAPILSELPGSFCAFRIVLLKFRGTAQASPPQ